MKEYLNQIRSRYFWNFCNCLHKLNWQHILQIKGRLKVSSDETAINEKSKLNNIANSIAKLHSHYQSRTKVSSNLNISIILKNNFCTYSECVVEFNTHYKSPNCSHYNLFNFIVWIFKYRSLIISQFFLIQNKTWVGFF